MFDNDVTSWVHGITVDNSEVDSALATMLTFFIGSSVSLPVLIVDERPNEQKAIMFQVEGTWTAVTKFRERGEKPGGLFTKGAFFPLRRVPQPGEWPMN